MDKLEILNTKLTAVNDEIRELSGSEGKLGLDAMAENVRSGNDEITLQTELLEQAVAELQGKVDPKLYDKGYAEGEIKGKAEGEQIGYDKALAEGYIKPSGTIEITENNKEYDVASYEKANVTITVQNKLAQVADKTITEITAEDLKGATSIGNRFFENCKSLITVELPEGITSIGEYVFYQCTSLETINLPDSLLNFGQQFVTKSQIESIVIPRQITQIPNYSFQQNSKLASVTLPEGLLEIGNSVFANTSKLTKMTIPSTVTKIGSSVWSYGSLKELILLPTTPPAIQTNTIHSSNSTTKIYVPAESIETYKAATNWSAYADRIFAIEE